MSRERDSADDARLLQQIRSALHGNGGNLSAATGEIAAVEEEEDVRLEYFLRAPASIGVDAPNLTPSSKAPSPAGDADEDVQMRASTGDQAKHISAAAAAAAGTATPAIPVSTCADDGIADDHHTADVAFTAAPKSPGAVVAALPASAAAVKPSPVPAAKPTAKSSAAAAANAAKKAKTAAAGTASSSKRKHKGGSAGPARVTRVV